MLVWRSLASIYLHLRRVSAVRQWDRSLAAERRQAGAFRLRAYLDDACAYE